MVEQADVEREIVVSHHTISSGRLTIVTLSRPKKYNALSGQHYRYLAKVMREISDDVGTIATVLIGEGKYFSAGADFNTPGELARSSTGDERVALLAGFSTGNLNITSVFLNHKNPLFICLNGPVIGLSAALVAFGDFIYATEDTYLLTPFSSLGLAPEGGASYMFPLKMGHNLANRALILSEKLSAKELYNAGFITKFFDANNFRDNCLKHIDAVMEDKNIESMRIAKAHMLRHVRDQTELHNVREVYGAVDRFAAGIPQTQFARLASKEKKHKL